MSPIEATHSDPREVVRRICIVGSAVALAAIGATFIIGGNLDGPGPVFRAARILPELGWGVWALVAGAGIANPRTRLPALALATGWFSLWAATLIVGLFLAGGPFYAIFVYLLLAGLFAMFFVLEWVER